MIEGAQWRRWVFFYIPLGVFVFVLLFPFYWMMVTTVRPDSELYRPWMAPNYTPFWTFHPTLEHIKYLLGETLFECVDSFLKLINFLPKLSGIIRRRWRGLSPEPGSQYEYRYC